MKIDRRFSQFVTGLSAHGQLVHGFKVRLEFFFVDELSVSPVSLAVTCGTIMFIYDVVLLEGWRVGALMVYTEKSFRNLIISN